MKFNIAIDGPSAAGKSTIAKILAKKYNLSHLDTGAMYRCVAYLSKKNDIDKADTSRLLAMIHNMTLDFKSDGSIYLNGEDVSSEIRANDISMLASDISANPYVREVLVEMQKSMAKQKGYILDGRDIGTVVLPDAEFKFFLVASSEARSQRRFKEYQQKGIDLSYEAIFEDIRKRDYQDTHRLSSPLRKAADAYEIDSSSLGIEAVIEKICKIIEG